MKAGILTFHGSHNFGSVLQAYAMQKTIEKMGIDSEIIDFRPETQRKIYRIFNRNNSLSNFTMNIYKGVYYTKLKRRQERFEEFIKSELKKSPRNYTDPGELYKEPPSYDTYICGSDQIWNMSCLDYNDIYFCDFVRNKARKIAYSPSIGNPNLTKERAERLEKLLKNMDCISVREKGCVKALSRLTEKKVKATVDPTLLLSREEWKRLAIEPDIKKPYILSYFLNNNNGDRSLLELIHEVTGLDIVVLQPYKKDIFKPYIKMLDAGPREFLGLINNASLFYTNSFHGTIFSVIFETPFLTAIQNPANKSVNNSDLRKIDLLSDAGLSERLVADREGVINSISKDIDFKSAKEKLDKRIKESREFLASSLFQGKENNRACD